jgi:NhaP-type Na+/H+ or K+/H+ antiporter
LLEQLSAALTLYPAAMLWFLYSLVASMTIGIALGWLTHRAAERFNEGEIPILFGLAVAFGAYVGTEWVHASGFLATTTVGIVIGNHRWFFSETKVESHELDNFMAASEGFEEPLADFATIFIFVLLGASLDPSLFSTGLWSQMTIALGLVLLVRPLGVMAVLLPRRWSWRQSLFVGLEGPRGVVPAAMAGLPLALATTYHQPQLAHWGEHLLTTTLMCIFVSVILSTSWMGWLGRGLGIIPSTTERISGDD